jgi:hypothetical protein
MTPQCIAGGCGSNFAYAAWMAGTTASVLDFRHQFQRHLLLVNKAAAVSVAEHAKSGQEQGTAREFDAQSALHKEESVRLDEQAAALRARADEHAASASALEGEADQVEESVVELQSEAAEQLSVAAVEEGVANRATALGFEQSEAALSKGMRAHAEEVGIALCQAAPGLDVLCDVLGGVTAVGLEAAAAVQSTEAVVDFTAAATAKESEEAELASAAELEAQAVAEQAAAATEHEEASALTEKAAAERADADVDQARADELMEQSAAEEEKAAAATEQSLQDEDMAASAEQQAAQHGVLAIGYAILQSAMAGVTIVYVGARFIVTTFVHVMSSATRGVSDKGTASITNPTSWGFLLSSVVHSIALVYVSETALMNPSPNDRQTLNLEVDLRQRGGAILLTSIVAVGLQLVLIHSVRYRTMLCHHSWPSCRLGLRIIAETALFWLWNLLAVVCSLRFRNAVSQGRWDYLRGESLTLSAWLALGLALCLTLTVHHWLWLRECSHTARARPRPVSAALASEATSLLLAGDDVLAIPTPDKRNETATTVAVVWPLSHQLALDLWFTCVLAGVLSGIAGQTRVLRKFWPLAKGMALEWSRRYKWAILAVVAASSLVAVIAGVVVQPPSYCDRRRHRRGSCVQLE